jgi:hypothetical protein
MFCYAECHYAECCYAECHGALWKALTDLQNNFTRNWIAFWNGAMTLSIMTLSIMTLSIMTMNIMTLNIMTLIFILKISLPFSESFLIRVIILRFEVGKQLFKV